MSNHPLQYVRYTKLEPAQFPLAKKFYKANRYSDKTNRLDEIFAAYHHNEIVGCVRFSPLENQTLLRAMVVAKDFRGLGIASQLIDYSLTHCTANEVWTFPFVELTKFYRKSRFSEKEIEQAPVVIQTAFAQYLQQGRNICLMVWNTPQQAGER